MPATPSTQKSAADVQDPTCDECLSLLTQATLRNHQLELQASDSEGDMVVARTRVIGFTEGHLVIAQPRGLGKDTRASWFKCVDAYLIMSGKVFRFRTSVVQFGFEYQLNAEKRCSAATLTMPQSLEETQRRNYFRVSMASQPPIQGMAAKLITEEPVHSPLEGPKLEGLVANLSEGGIGIRVETPYHMRYTLDERYSITFTLPGEEKPVMIVGRLMNTRSIRKGEASRFGFMFLHWPDPHFFGKAIQPIRRFVVSCQREQMNRMR